MESGFTRLRHGPLKAESSLRCRRSVPTPPYTKPPRRPLPTGIALVMPLAGELYHMRLPSARTRADKTKRSRPCKQDPTFMASASIRSIKWCQETVVILLCKSLTAVRSRKQRGEGDDVQYRRYIYTFWQR